MGNATETFNSLSLVLILAGICLAWRLDQLKLRNKSNLCLDSGNYAWEYMGCSTNDSQFGSDKTYVGGPWGANQGQWKNSGKKYVGVARTGVNAHGFEWDNEPKLTLSNASACVILNINLQICHFFIY